MPPDSEYTRYERQRLAYLRDLRETLAARQELAVLKESRTLSLELVLHNSRNEAQDLDVELRFPSELEVYTPEGFPGEPRLPDPPAKPMPVALARAMSHVSFSREVGLLPGYVRALPLDPIAPNVGPIVVTHTEAGPLARLSVSRLRTSPLSCGRLLVVFADFDNAVPFELGYTITASNIAKEHKGKVRVKPVKAAKADVPRPRDLADGEGS